MQSLILIVEDNEAMKQYFISGLRDQYWDLRFAKSLKEAEEAFEEREPSLVLLDYNLPDGSGVDLLQQWQKDGRLLNLPVFIMSGNKSSAIKRRCFEHGADGYFEKSTDLAVLSEAIKTRLAKREVYQANALRDSLTGLFNRTGFNQAFKVAQREVAKAGAGLSLAIIDIDHFKAINDSYGHDQGDIVLRRLAGIVRDSLRVADVVGRWGGEEFVIFFPQLEVVEAYFALRQVQAALQAEAFSAGKGSLFHVTFSAGIVRVSSVALLEPAVKRADRYLYQAKALGRDRIVCDGDHVGQIRKQLLLIDDSRASAELIGGILRPAGFDVIARPTMESAASVIKRGDVSAVLVAVESGPLSSVDVLRRFRTLAAYRRMPIVLVSSRARTEDIVEGFHLGADEYICRPFAPPELLARVQRLVRA